MIKLKNIVDIEKLSKDFVKNLNKSANLFKKNGNWFPIWNFFDKYPDILSEDEAHDVDNMLAKLHNKNIIPKRLTFSQKLYTLLDLFEAYNKIHPLNMPFFDWVLYDTIDVYRGVNNKNNIIKKIDKNKFYSFTLRKDIAKIFTQGSYVQGVFREKELQNGYILNYKISVKNNFYIFNDAGWEKEVIVKGPATINKIIKIRKGIDK